MQKIIIFSLLTMSLLFSMTVTAGKKHCKGYRSKLDNVQTQQRQSNSNKRSQSLAVKESKARNTWWQCETGKLKPKTKKKKQKKVAKQRRKKSLKSTTVRAEQKPYKAIKPLIPFASDHPVVVRSKYQVEKLQAWLSFYKPAKMCARPKSTQQFAACVEDKRRQQIEFDNYY